MAIVDIKSLFINIPLTKTLNLCLQNLYRKHTIKTINLKDQFYGKPTFSSIFINFESFKIDMYKYGLLETLLHRSFRLCSNYENLIKHNNYLENFIHQYIYKFLNKVFIKKDLVSGFLKGS